MSNILWVLMGRYLCAYRNHSHDYDYDKHISSGPLRPIKYYSSKKEILSRFRLMPPQECKNDWYLRFIAEFSIKETSDGWRWKFDDRLFRSLKRLDGYGFSFSCPDRKMKTHIHPVVLMI